MMTPATHTLTSRTRRPDRPRPEELRRWFAANQLLRMSDIARVTTQAGLTLDSHQAAQLTQATDEYDAATHVHAALTRPTMDERITADARAIAASILEA